MLNRSTILVMAILTTVIMFSIVIVVYVDRLTTPKTFPEVVTVGPVWITNTWVCTSNSDFMVYGTVRALPNATLAISISGLGTQSLYAFTPSDLYSFTVGSPGGHTMSITRTGTVTGWITLETKEGATASCNPF